MNSPCIRNLDRFKKKGCPEKLWNGKEGCSCWIEMSVSNRDNPEKKEIKKNCIDLWQFDFQWAMLGLLEGNQEATERFRNAMVQPDPTDPFNDNKAHPKSDPATIYLCEVLDKVMNTKQIIDQYEDMKKIQYKT